MNCIEILREVKSITKRVEFTIADVIEETEKVLQLFDGIDADDCSEQELNDLAALFGYVHAVRLGYIKETEAEAGIRSIVRRVEY